MKAHLKCGKDTLNDNLSLRASCGAEDSPSRTHGRGVSEGRLEGPGHNPEEHLWRS